MRTEKKKRKMKLLSLILSAVQFLTLLLPWVSLKGKSYTILEFYLATAEAGGPEAFSGGDVGLYPLYLFLLPGALACLLSGIRAVLFVMGKNTDRLEKSVNILVWGYMAGIFSFGAGTATAAFFLLLLTTVINFMVNRYLEQFEEFTGRSTKLGAEENARQKERKERLRFPGRYPPLLYRVFLESAGKEKKSWLLLLICGSFSSFYLFTVLGLNEALQNIHTEELLFLGKGLQEIMKEALQILAVIHMVLMVFAFSGWRRLRSAQEQLLARLGARKQLRSRIRAAEYGICVLVSLPAGWIPGILLLALAGQRFEGTESAFLPGPAVYGKSMVLFLAATLLSLAVSGGLFEEKDSTAKEERPKREPVPGRKTILIGAASGALFLGMGLFLFHKRTWAEGLGLLFLEAAGAGLLLAANGARLITGKEKSGKTPTAERLLASIPFTFHYRRSFGCIAILLAIHFLALGLFGNRLASSLAAGPAETLYPYDFVCMAYPEDMPLFQSLEEEAEILDVPMVRVTSVQGDAYDWKDAATNAFMDVMWPQGQHVGISWSTYRKLCQNAGLLPTETEPEGEEIHIVYQQDAAVRAHPLDWYLHKKTPYLRIGQPLEYYDFVDRARYYPPRRVKSEETRILTGMFGRGMQENLVVFSDQYFAGLFPEGPTRLILIRTGEEHREKVKTVLEEFARRHRADSRWDSDIQPYYDSRQSMDDVRTERLLEDSISGFGLALLAVCSIQVLSLKYVFEYQEMEERYRLLGQTGMREKAGRKLLRREIRPFFLLSLGPALLLWGWRAAETVRLRMYTGKELLSFAGYAAGITAVWILVQTVFAAVLYQKLKKAGKETRKRGGSL